ncbi:DUF4224 domain-containing protein [Ralstonia syzygii]|nr:DUF4224 domain-containing protein [Ralstonia syzygii]
MFLTDDEVSRLTGRRMKGAQIDALGTWVFRSW